MVLLEHVFCAMMLPLPPYSFIFIRCEQNCIFIGPHRYAGVDAVFDRHQPTTMQIC